VPVQTPLALRGVSQRCASVQAPVDVELEIRDRGVVALVGDNAAPHRSTGPEEAWP
jgi:hypothetical protein